MEEPITKETYVYEMSRLNIMLQRKSDFDISIENLAARIATYESRVGEK